ncbi:sensor histidine kinase [Konateibacter massiliensis]|uniref:sensor histidine kinase n=1 Tax=Konateibacter massiliensis TaxID=2002841 RepID=UPI000C14B604|nr:histidine kinase [Konateibacter massiliensis]
MKLKKVLHQIFQTSVFRLVFIIVILILPINILTLVFSSLTIEEVENQISLETQSALNLYMSQIDSAIESITMKMHETAINDIDFGRINVKEVDDKEEYYNQLQSAVNLKNTFDGIREDNKLVTGVFAVFPQKDVSIISSNYSTYDKVVTSYVKERIEDETVENLKQWEIVSVEDTENILFISKYKEGYYGAWINLSRLADKMEIFGDSGDTIRAFTDEMGNSHYSNQSDFTAVELDKEHGSYGSESYVLVKAKSKYANLYVVQILFKNAITNDLPAIVQILKVCSVLALCILPIMIGALRRWMISPINRLSEAMQEVEAGNMDFRIAEDVHTGSEFEQINRNFNHMMEEVSNLKIDVYEEQLKSKDIKMRFLSQQIQPHFILNAMNIIYSYEPEEYPLIQKMILCLSKYFRYVVNANVDFVKLCDEMEYIRNYFEIQQARYPKTFFAVVEFDEEIADCLVPPLLIQNFAENAIKHSLKIGNKIDIFVIGQNMDGKYIKIRMVDTGEGIKDELIEKVEIFRKTRIYQDGLGVGIQNAIERLDTIYGEEARLKILQVNPHGTEVEMILPLRRGKEEEDAEYDFS